MYKYIETQNQQTNEIVRRMHVSSHSERVAGTFVNTVNNSIRDNNHIAKMKESNIPLELF